MTKYEDVETAVAINENKSGKTEQSTVYNYNKIFNKRKIQF